MCVVVIVNNSVPHRSVRLDSPFKLLRLTFPLIRPLLCVLFISLCLQIDIKKLDHLTDQLPKPLILVGDFNSLNTFFGCTNTNDKGRTIEDFITKHDFVLLSEKSSTYLHPAIGS